MSNTTKAVKHDLVALTETGSAMADAPDVVDYPADDSADYPDATSDADDSADAIDRDRRLAGATGASDTAPGMPRLPRMAPDTSLFVSMRIGGRDAPTLILPRAHALRIIRLIGDARVITKSEHFPYDDKTPQTIDAIDITLKILPPAVLEKMLVPF